MKRALEIDEIEEIIQALRDGATLSTPGSRCHSTWGCQGGRWYREDFDEGAVDTRESSETCVRELLAEQGELGLTLLRSRRWSGVRDAAARGDRSAALSALSAWIDYGGSPDRGLVTAAWLTPADPIRDAPTRAALRALFRDGTLFHLFMDLHGWPTSPGGAARCLDFVDGLMARLDENVPDITALRQRLQERIAAEGR